MTVCLTDNVNGKYHRISKDDAAYISCLLAQLGINHNLLHVDKIFGLHTLEIQLKVNKALCQNTIVTHLDGLGNPIPIVMDQSETKNLPKLDLSWREKLSDYLKFLESCKDGYYT